MTGIGAVINRAKVTPGSSVAVFGAGGVGLSAIMGARLAGAETIIAVEPVGSKRALALALGATHALDGNDPDLVEKLLDHSGGGVDYAFEAAGLTRLTELAFSATRPGGHDRRRRHPTGRGHRVAARPGARPLGAGRDRDPCTAPRTRRSTCR